MLMTKQGKFIKGSQGGNDRFLFSLTMLEGILEAGEYTIMVDPQFNDSVNYDLEYKKIMVDVYSTCAVNLTPVQFDIGLESLQKTLVGIAETKADRMYPAQNTDYGQSVWTAKNLFSSGCWMGFYYVKNESDAIFSMKFTPKLEGVEVIGRPWST
jgi:hypothetical protein